MLSLALVCLQAVRTSSQRSLCINTQGTSEARKRKAEGWGNGSKCLLHKHQDLGSDPQDPSKKLGMALHISSPSVWEAETDGIYQSSQLRGDRGGYHLLMDTVVAISRIRGLNIC